MTRRQEGIRVRQIVREVTDDKTASVRSGRGTAHSWWYINAKATRRQQDEVECRCAKEGLLGHYYGDYGPGNDVPNACVRWDGITLPAEPEGTLGVRDEKRLKKVRA